MMHAVSVTCSSEEASFTSYQIIRRGVDGTHNVYHTLCVPFISLIGAFAVSKLDNFRQDTS